MRYVHIYNRQKDQLVLWFPGSVVEAFEQKKKQHKAAQLVTYMWHKLHHVLPRKGGGEPNGEKQINKLKKRVS